MITAELYAGPEDGRIVTVPGPAPSELRVPDSLTVRYVRPVFEPIPAHVYRWHGSRGSAAVYRYERTD